GIMDDDRVDVTNLQRQVVHRANCIGRSKAASASETMRALNPAVRVLPLGSRLCRENALMTIGDFDLVVDGSDNFPTRYLLNDVCALADKPLVFGSIFRYEGQTTVFDARRGPCYRCLFPEPPDPASVPTCAEGGVLGVLPGLVGMVQATETLKLLLGIGEPLIGRLLLVDALALRFTEIAIEKNPECPLCGTSPTITQLIDYEAFCGAKTCETDREGWEITRSEAQRWAAQGSVVFVDIREDWELDEKPGIDGARHIPYPLFSRRMAELDSAATIVVYCTRGIRSWHAVTLLRQAGFSRAWYLDGGLESEG
ncbi:MAG TPA: ThiF family adenylyltransferase, partial [Armatimonadota bacterium]